MKVRTDFVTNSSSSSFVVEIEVELTNQARYVFETKPTDYGANSDFMCTGKDITRAKDVKDLCDLLQMSMCGTGKAKIKTFAKKLSEEITDYSKIKTVTLRRIWVSMGESSGCTILNDEELQTLAKNVTKSKGKDQGDACEALREYLENAEVYVEGGWSDSWPTGFCKNKAIPRYKWEYLGISLKDLAKKIANGKINNDDLAVETIIVDISDKTITESADFIIDSKERGIGKKSASLSCEFLTTLIATKWPEYEIKKNVNIADIFPEQDVQCVPLDYVFYKDGVVKLAISVEASANVKTKELKVLMSVLDSVGLNYIILDQSKDNSEAKVISKINEVLLSDVFTQYIVEMKTEGLNEIEAENLDKACIVRVKFADNRSYEYNCFGEVRVGDIVYVGGSKSDQRGMVINVTEDKEVPSYYDVEKILRF